MSSPAGPPTEELSNRLAERNRLLLTDWFGGAVGRGGPAVWRANGLARAVRGVEDRIFLRKHAFTGLSQSSG
jgi:hypothetical protein